MESSLNNWPCHTEEEISAVQRVLQSNKTNYWTGNECRYFEDEFSSFTNCKYSIAVANGTLALDLAFQAIGIKDGDEVVVTPRTFLASVSSIVNAGATPVFADVDLISQNITRSSIEEVFTRKTKAIVCVHLAGWPCDMDEIMDFAKERGVFVIEDCAQAHGAFYKGRSVGTLGDIGCWSFCQDKIMTTGGEGGMVTTNHPELWKKMWAYKDHGKDFDVVYSTKHAPGFRWLHNSFGTNMRMTEMQAAIGRIQLKNLKSWNIQRRRNAQAIWDTVKNHPKIRLPAIGLEDNNSKNGSAHAAYRCYIFVESSVSDRNAIIEKITSKGIPCFTGSCSEVYLEKAFENKTYKPLRRLPNAKILGDQSIAFLCHPTLKEEDLKKMCLIIQNAITEQFRSED